MGRKTKIKEKELKIIGGFLGYMGEHCKFFLAPENGFSHHKKLAPVGESG